MVKEAVDDSEDSEPSVCERNGMIHMHEQSEVINQDVKVLFWSEGTLLFLLSFFKNKTLNVKGT